MRCRSSANDRGAVTAELAIGIPTVLGLVGLVLGAMRLGMDGVTATTVASETAFAIARGDDSGSALHSARSVLPTGDWSANLSAGRVCVSATIPAAIPFAPPMVIRQCVST